MQGFIRSLSSRCSIGSASGDISDHQVGSAESRGMGDLSVFCGGRGASWAGRGGDIRVSGRAYRLGAIVTLSLRVGVYVEA